MERVRININGRHCIHIPVTASQQSCEVIYLKKI